MDRERTRVQEAVFFAKTRALGLARQLEDARVPLPVGDTLPRSAEGWRIAGRSQTTLWPEEMNSDARLIAGKVQNLRVAATRLGRRRFGAGEVFSFWRHVGRPTRRAGYVTGREIREGCLVPSVGGGLCQLSNALYDAALEAGMEILERHPHTVIVPGSLAERGRDATVFFPYVDLRFAAAQPFEVEARLTADALVVEIRAPDRLGTISSVACGDARPGPTGSCHDCGVAACASYAPHLAELAREDAAFLVDRFGPELDAWIQTERGGGDVLVCPLDGQRLGRANYAWTTRGFGDMRNTPLLALGRALASRRLRAQGAERQRAGLTWDARLARAMMRAVDRDVRHIVVQQHLLPTLYLEGALGGRTYDVLATRLPLHALHARLDLAAAHHPTSPTLADFRAPAELVRAEREALAGARRVITAHTELAYLFGERALRLPWRIGERAPASEGRHVVFLGPTVGRKGAYLLRDAARSLRLPLRVAGRDLEGSFDWGVSVESAGPDPFADAAVVVAPAYVEHEPRGLLHALERGVPVIASEACGLGDLAGVTTIPTGCAESLRDALSAHVH